VYPCSDPCRGIYQKPVPEEEVASRFEMMPLALRQALMPFQREGVMYGLQHQGRVLIADEVSGWLTGIRQGNPLMPWRVGPIVGAPLVPEASV
jgi:hypothetical protein